MHLGSHIFIRNIKKTRQRKVHITQVFQMTQLNKTQKFFNTHSTDLSKEGASKSYWHIKRLFFRRRFLFGHAKTSKWHKFETHTQYDLESFTSRHSNLRNNKRGNNLFLHYFILTTNFSEVLKGSHCWRRKSKRKKDSCGEGKSLYSTACDQIFTVSDCGVQLILQGI